MNSRHNKQASPPRWIDHILEWFCDPRMLEEVQGDLYELYGKWIAAHGVRKANRLYAWHAIKFFSPYAIKRNTQHDSINDIDMLRNYFKVGIRNILKYKVFSFINIFGLAVAMSVCMLIILMLADQKNYDQFHENKDRIYRILSDEENSKAPNAVTPFPLASTLKAEYSIISASTHLIRGVGGDITYNEKIVEMQGFFADTSFFSVFSYDLAQGNKQKALQMPNSMVITSELAHKLFKDENPIGKTVEFFDRGGGLASPPVSWGLYTITGVIADKNYKSHLKFDVLVSSSSIHSLSQAKKISDFTQSWQDEQSYTYVLLIPRHDYEDLTVALHDLVSHTYADIEASKGFILMGQKLTDITPGMLVRNAPTDSLPMIAYYFLGFLALVILISACLNYTNLSIARSLTRAKEIGVRKVTGANRKDLMYQFLSESILTALLALALAMILLVFIKPAFMSLWINQHLNFDLQENITIYLIFLALAVLIGFFAGAYPALHLSTYQPIKTLKNLGSMRAGKLGLRKVLSVSQFVISLFFIITSILIYNQFRHYLEFEYEFNTKNIVNIALQGNDYQQISNAFNTVTGVAAISASDIIPATNADNGTSLRIVGSQEDYQQFNIIQTDENFISNLGLNLIAGRNLPTPGGASDRFIVVNEAAVKTLGYQYPSEVIGQVLESKYSKEALEVIGVVEDFRFKMLMNEDKIGPLVLQNQPDQFRYTNVTITSNNLMGTIAKLEDKWKSIDPVHPFKYEFYDEQLASMYQEIFDLVSIIGFIAFLAITIACLGMLGMATYTAERRTKEVGIRKVLGAEEFTVALLLSKSFLKILLISIGIAAPLSYFINNLWLQYLPNRVDFGLGIILLGSLLLLVLGLVAIGSQTLRVAKANPVDALRME